MLFSETVHTDSVSEPTYFSSSYHRLQ